MKVNDNEFYLILSSPEENGAIQIQKSTIKCSKVKKLLVIHIDHKLKFDTHDETICKKAHRKLNALLRITNSKLYRASKKTCFYKCVSKCSVKLLPSYSDVSKPQFK